MELKRDRDGLEALDKIVLDPQHTNSDGTVGTLTLRITTSKASRGGIGTAAVCVLYVGPGENFQFRYPADFMAQVAVDRNARATKKNIITQQSAAMANIAGGSPEGPRLLQDPGAEAGAVHRPGPTGHDRQGRGRLGSQLPGLRGLTMRDLVSTIIIIAAMGAAFAMGYRAGAGPQPVPVQLPVNTGWVEA